MSSSSFLCVCLNPTLQKTLSYRRLRINEVNRTSTYSLDASGKGVNVTRVLTQLGRSAVHLTQAGGSLAPLFSSLCRRDDLALASVPTESEIRFCTTLIDEDARTVTELVEESAAVSVGTEDRVLDRFLQELKGARTLIVSGTKAAGFSDAVVPTMTKEAKLRGLRVILDVRGKDLTGSLPYEPDLIKPNLHEFLTTYLPDLVEPALDHGIEAIQGGKERVIEAAGQVASAHGCTVVLTRGSSSVWAHDGASFFEVPITSVVPVNTVGSGDAFTAGLASALDSGAALVDAILEGGRCGALNAGLLRPGVIC